MTRQIESIGGRGEYRAPAGLDPDLAGDRRWARLNCTRGAGDIVGAVVRLISPAFSCPECGEPLEYTGATMAASPAAGEEAWRVPIERESIACARGHTYVAIYEQREPWLRALVAVGDRIVSSAAG